MMNYVGHEYQIEKVRLTGSELREDDEDRDDGEGEDIETD